MSQFITFNFISLQFIPSHSKGKTSSPSDATSHQSSHRLARRLLRVLRQRVRRIAAQALLRLVAVLLRGALLGRAALLVGVGRCRARLRF